MDLLYFADICAGPGGFSEYMLWRKRWHCKGFGFTLKGFVLLFTVMVFIELENSENSLNVKANGSFYIFSHVFVVWLGSKGSMRNHRMIFVPFTIF